MVSVMTDPEILAGHSQEVRRGSVVVASLLLLRRPGYGYGLLEALAAAGVPVDANTLYPLLRRLEKQGLLVSHWTTAEPWPRQSSRTSPGGDALARSLLDYWLATARRLLTIDSREGTPSRSPTAATPRRSAASPPRSTRTSSRS